MIYISHLLSDEEMAEISEQEDVGIESIDFSIGYCLDEYDKTMEKYKERLKKMSFQQLSIHGPFLDLNLASNDTRIKRVTMERFQQAYDAAVELGAKKIVYHSCFIPKVNFQEGWSQLATAFWDEFLEDKDESIQIAMENVFDPTYEGILETVGKVKHPAFCACLDLGHANHASDIPITQWIEALAPVLGHIHIHDNDKITDGHLAVGEGTIPWEEVFASLCSYCPHVDYAIENSRKEDVFTTLNRMKKENIV